MRIRLRTLGIALALAAAAAGAFVVAGIYNIGAIEQHTGPVYRLLDYAMRRSVKVRAGEIRVPDLTDAQRLRDGFRHYRAHCVQCHGAPGVAPDALAMGMTPAPANLVATAREWHAPEIYWAVRHGIKMTGMPAWEYRLSEGEIWDVVAFVEALPLLSPAEYAALAGKAPRPAYEVTPAGNVHLGDAQAGWRAIGQYLCATCHRIPGVTGASRDVGPPLAGIATRTYIAGILPNTPANMVRWLQHPTRIDPLSAMPDLGVSEQDARDIAAYLYTLEGVE